MNTYQQNNILEQFKHFFTRRSALPRLIIINTAVFLLVYLVNLIIWLFQINPTGLQNGLSPLTSLLAVPASLSALAAKPWTVFTYMFLHEGFLHLFFNMWVLYFGGTIFLQYLSQKRLISTYIAGGLAGAFFYVLAYNLFPVFSQLNHVSVALGASASVLAILVAIATYVPQYTVNLLLIGPVRLKYLAIGLVILDFFSIQGNNPGGHIAHLGGALWGFSYVWMLQRGQDVYAIFNGIFDRKMKVKPGGKQKTSSSRPLTDEEYNAQKAKEQEKIDAILDKIAKKGYSSLTKAEKEILFKSSHKN